MEKLANDWITQGLMDFEYKKYILLAYLKTAGDSFGRVKLYPFLSDLIFHYRNLMSIKENKALIREAFPKEISTEDFRKLELGYRKIVEDDAVMNELESILEFAIPKIKGTVKEGTAIYEYVESQCEVSPIGVTPLYAKEGYIFVTQPPEKETNVYRYQVSIFEGSQEEMRSLNTQHIDTVAKGPGRTYEGIKLDLIRTHKDLPNPATYLFLSRINVPLGETLMPIVKRMLVRQVTQAA